MLGSAWHADVFIWLLVHPVGLSVSGAATAAGEVTSTRLLPTTTVITAGSPRTRWLMLLPRPLSVEQGMKVTPDLGPEEVPLLESLFFFSTPLFLGVLLVFFFMFCWFHSKCWDNILVELHNMCREEFHTVFARWETISEVLRAIRAFCRFMWRCPDVEIGPMKAPSRHGSSQILFHFSLHFQLDLWLNMAGILMEF